MSDKNHQEKIAKAAWSLVENIKSAVSLNLAQAAKQGTIEVKPEGLQKLISVVSTSIEEGYFASQRTFQKTVEEALNVEGSQHLAPAKTKKKT